MEKTSSRLTGPRTLKTGCFCLSFFSCAYIPSLKTSVGISPLPVLISCMFRLLGTLIAVGGQEGDVCLSVCTSLMNRNNTRILHGPDWYRKTALFSVTKTAFHTPLADFRSQNKFKTDQLLVQNMHTGKLPGVCWPKVSLITLRHKSPQSLTFCMDS